MKNTKPTKADIQCLIQGYEYEIDDLKTKLECDSALWCAENNITVDEEIANLEKEKQELITML